MKNVVERAPKAQWAPQKAKSGYGLPESAIALMNINIGEKSKDTRKDTPRQHDQDRPGDKDAAEEVPDGSGAAAPQPAAEAEKQARAHRPRRPRQCPNLPEPFTEEDDSIGAPIRDPSDPKHPKPCPPVRVVFYGQKNIPEDYLQEHPSGEKLARPNKQLTVPEHLVAAQYSDDNGYTIDGAPHTELAPRPARLPRPC